MSPFFGALILIFMLFFLEIESSKNIERIKMKKSASSEEEDARRIALHATPRLSTSQSQSSPQSPTSTQNEALDLQETKPRRRRNKNPLFYYPHVSPGVQKTQKFMEERFNSELRLPPKHFQDNQKLTRQKIDREYSELVFFNDRYPSDLSSSQISGGHAGGSDPWLSNLKAYRKQQQNTLDNNMGVSNPPYQSHYPDSRPNPQFPGAHSGGSEPWLSLQQPHTFLGQQHHTLDNNMGENHPNHQSHYADSRFNPHFPGAHSGGSEPWLSLQQPHTFLGQQQQTLYNNMGFNNSHLKSHYPDSLPNPHFPGAHSGGSEPWLSLQQPHTFPDQQHHTFDNNMGVNNPHHQSHYPDGRPNPPFPEGHSGDYGSG